MQITIIDVVLICIMEHGLSPSAIAARQTFLGAPESLQGAVASGILGVGSHYAGTSGECASLLEEIVTASPENRYALAAAAIARRFRADRRALPGYQVILFTRMVIPERPGLCRSLARQAPKAITLTRCFCSATR